MLSSILIILVECLRLYLAVSSRAKGIGKAAVHRSTLYYDAFGVFATQDIVTLANSAPCDAIGKISGDIIVPSSTGGTPPIYNPKRAAAVWTTTYTASGCVQLILSSEDQHGIWVNDPLDATRENCVLVAWAPQRLATSKPIAKDEENLVAHGVERWASRFFRGEFSSFPQEVQSALWERVCLRYGSSIAYSILECFEQHTRPLFWGALEPQSTGKSDWYAKPLSADQSFLTEFHSYGGNSVTSQPLVALSTSEESSSQCKRSRTGEKEAPKTEMLQQRIQRLISELSKPMSEWIPAPPPRLHSFHASGIWPSTEYAPEVQAFLHSEYWPGCIRDHCCYMASKQRAAELESSLEQLTSQLGKAEQRQQSAERCYCMAKSILTSALEALIAADESVRMTTQATSILQAEYEHLNEALSTADQEMKRAKESARMRLRSIQERLRERFGVEAARATLTPCMSTGNTHPIPARYRDISAFRSPTLEGLHHRASTLADSVCTQVRQALPLTLRRRTVDVRVTSIADSDTVVSDDYIAAQWQWIQVHALRSEPRNSGEWIPRDYLGSNHVLIHAWVHLRGLSDRLMFNPRTQEWRPIDTNASFHPTYKCIANLDPGSATTLISMHTARQLQCPIHQNCDALSMKGVQGANFEAGYHCTVLIGVIGTYWDPELEQYRNGAYEMVVQALILPTLSVPILIGNQALCDHFYANVPGSLDFSFGEHTRVDCKAIKYEVVRQHCIADSSALASTVSTAGEPIPEFSEKLGCPRPPGFPPPSGNTYLPSTDIRLKRCFRDIHLSVWMRC